MYGFLLRPRWIAFHLLVLGGVVLMVGLGFWQLRRLDERREFNAIVSARVDQPPVPLEELLVEVSAGAPLERIEWRQVTTSGTWVPDQVLWFNRSQGGVAGDNVLTALTGGADDTVIVNRGFVALGADVPAAPSGDVDVVARVRLPHERQRGELTDDTDGPVSEVRRVDLDQLGAQFAGDLAPVYLDVVATDPPVTETDPTPVPPPPLDEGSHLSYAFQWFIFATCVVIGWVLAVRRSISTRRSASAGSASFRSASAGSASAHTSGSDVAADADHEHAVSDGRARPSDGTVRSHPGSDAPDRASGTPSPR